MNPRIRFFFWQKVWGALTTMPCSPYLKVLYPEAPFCRVGSSLERIGSGVGWLHRRRDFRTSPIGNPETFVAIGFWDASTSAIRQFTLGSKHKPCVGCNPRIRNHWRELVLFSSVQIRVNTRRHIHNSTHNEASLAVMSMFVGSIASVFSIADFRFGCDSNSSEFVFTSGSLH